ncbi:MAG: helix-turn-helix domain-containing protein [Pseudolabrys sp.]|nr:helix-turn-helix domain-containing protein [Pseudolabrys sp.]
MPPPPVAHMIFDTTTLPEPTARAIWHDTLGQLYDVQRRDEAESFAACIGVWNIGGLIMTEGQFSGARLLRSARRARTDGFDHYTFILQKKGRWQADTGDRLLESGPGRVCAMDVSRPIVTDVGDNDSITLTLPRDVLDAVLPPFDMHGLVLDGARGALLYDFIVSLQGRAGAGNGPEAPQLAEAIRQMVAACLSPSRDAAARARPQIDSVLLRRATAHIDANLANPEWGGNDLGLVMQVSRSTLYRLFVEFGGVASYIRARRLARAHLLLANPQERRSVSEIAAICGFQNDTSFSRAFRETFGYSPREARFGKPGPADTAGSGTRDAAIVVEWINRLRVPAAGGP